MQTWKSPPLPPLTGFDPRLVDVTKDEQHTPEVSLFKPLSWNFILRPPHLEPTHQQHHQEGKQHPWIRRCPTACKKTAYVALVRPLLEYGAIIWDPYQKQDISKMERIQRNAVRFIARDYKSKTPASVTSSS